MHLTLAIYSTCIVVAACHPQRWGTSTTKGARRRRRSPPTSSLLTERLCLIWPLTLTCGALLLLQPKAASCCINSTMDESFYSSLMFFFFYKINELLVKVFIWLVIYITCLLYFFGARKKNEQLYHFKIFLIWIFSNYSMIGNDIPWYKSIKTSNQQPVCVYFSLFLFSTIHKCICSRQS